MCLLSLNTKSPLWETWLIGMTNGSWLVHSFYQSESKTFLHMFEFSWWRGNSEPGTSCFFLMRFTKFFPDDRLSYLVIYWLKAEHRGDRVRSRGSWFSSIFLSTGTVSRYLTGKVALSICMHTRKGYSENLTVVMKSSDASVSKLTSTPALMKSMSTVTLPVTTKAPLKPPERE